MHKADFDRLLATRSRGRSAHFAVHHVSGEPAPVAPNRGRPRTPELSTTGVQVSPQAVDNLPEPAPAPAGRWLGCMVPKRQARRAVTRNLLKRQMRESFRRHAALLPTGLWLLRLHAGFAVAGFASARSDALADAARTELDRLLLAAAGRARGA